MYNPLETMLARYHRDSANRDDDGNLVLDADKSMHLITTFIDPSLPGYDAMQELRKKSALGSWPDTIDTFDRLGAFTLKTAIMNFNKTLDK